MSCCGGGESKQAAKETVAAPTGTTTTAPREEKTATANNDVVMSQATDAVTTSSPYTVPLTLSSMAYLSSSSVPDEGVLEGLRQVVHHSLLQATQYTHGAEVKATKWRAVKVKEGVDLPEGFSHLYLTESFLYCKSGSATGSTNDWMSSTNVLGRIALHHACEKELSQEELFMDEDTTSPVVLCKATVEYKSDPPKGSIKARQAEQLSMQSFGDGTGDDMVKLGALASLHDRVGRYVLQVESMRGNRYRFTESPQQLATVEIQETTLPLVTSMTLALSSAPRDALHPFSYPARPLQESFLLWNDYASATALPSHQTLLLQSSKTFVNGRLLEDVTLPPSLFGWSLHSIPVWHGRIQDYEVLKQEYSSLWQELLIDARLGHLDLASMLLMRLQYGREEDDDEDEDSDSDCLESIVMTKYDPVGICAKALATRFAATFGKTAVPCLAHEVEWVESRMGGKTPVVVPPRLLGVLRRGGYFDVQRDTMEMWFTERVRPVEEKEQEAVREAKDLLREAGCEEEVQIMIVNLNNGGADAIKSKYMCRYNDDLMQYHVNEAVWTLDKPAVAIALYVAHEHADGRILLNLLTRHHGA